MTSNDVVTRIKGLLDPWVGVGITSLQDVYKGDLLRLFEEVESNGVMIAGDALGDRLEERYPEDMSDQRYISLFKQVRTSWDEWLFFQEHAATP